ncbi:MAG: DUF4393 domain-containing protein [Kaiparowitsia implicata GSE-PSE-MK54-09C]|jgi:hypothetical protein|nr:DUF4393 domain-containing protein [Kaiparowitsia implicata GSE-PSE-MK54-09C]
MAEDRSLDIVGIGKLAEAIPEQAWTSIVNTACITFKQLISPLTAITSGTGRLIEARFDRLVDAEKVIASQILSRAADKASNSSRKRKNKPKPSIILKVIENSSSEVDTTLQELWTNLVANELVDGSVHPEFIRILSRLSAADAQRLIEVAQKSEPNFSIKLALEILNLLSMRIPLIEYEPTNFINAHLSNLDLIKQSDGIWNLTVIGRAFLEAVSDPSIEAT